MAFFPAFSTGDLNPLLRILDDSLHAYGHPYKPTTQCNPKSTTSTPSPSCGKAQFEHQDQTPLYRPAFDVKEYRDHYVLQGELAGVSQSAIDVEFIDPQTLRVAGRSERSSDTSASADLVVPAIESNRAAEHVETERVSSRQASVEDAPGPAREVEDWTAIQSSSIPSTTDPLDTSRVQKSIRQGTEEPKYWLSERTVGRFQRVFSFPDRVDAERVSASLKDGVLSVIVPKAPEPARVKISVH